MQQHERIESLHQQAAANYLQGDFEQALKFWQELLQIDPEDERALEGVRLCEMLSEEGEFPGAPAARAESVPIAAANPSELDVRGSSHAAAHDVGLDDEDLDFDLSALNMNGSPAGGLQGVTGGLELGDLPPIDLPGADSAGEEDGQGDLASAELRARVDELVLQATQSYDAGDAETALEVLSRVFILDETNPQALALQGQIQAEVERGHDDSLAGEHVERDGLDLDIGGDLSWDEPEAEPDRIPEAPAPSVPLAAPPAPAATPAAPKARRVPLRFSMPRLPQSPQVRLIAAGGLLAAAVGGWFGYSALFGTSDSAPPPSAAQAAPQEQRANPDGAAKPGKTDKGGKKNKKGKKGGAAADAEPVAPVYSAEQVPGLLEDARKAAAAGDYVAAIVAFNAVLGVDPTQAEAREGLNAAAERYREQQEYKNKMTTATDAWARGDYTTAMRIFYRLPEAQGNPVFARYIRDGWYNLGLQAMRAGNCADARKHLDEFRALAPDDRESAALFDLAGRCGYAARDPGFREELAALAPRPLD